MTDDLQASTTQAIAALTRAARLTYMTPGGEERRYDFGEIACQVITSVAANIGGTEELLAGRPGSWEADLVRQIVQGTAPAEDLSSYQTEGGR